ncbi:metal-responsive CopG/Arc/MetJ family transcriptional regulator [Caulobacter sp. BE264]|uniref:ribbon-helix-helix domain-containing protein n=1 Tax=Caulobacter sp. BE264 TaxID=2817724 RepID=UPI002855B14C|nr:ribbon-helix-helix domain-containing protein [Caulobacter sp. BE264]MDR7231409.1 metal-responsive CopG/Arc/MetJ family transcriptional regulator [Caulobacter sp. BE264]
MGRPKLNVKQVGVQLTPEILERIDAVVGQHRRSGFIRQAIEAALVKAEAEKAADPDQAG